MIVAIPLLRGQWKLVELLASWCGILSWLARVRLASRYLPAQGCRTNNMLGKNTGESIPIGREVSTSESTTVLAGERSSSQPLPSGAGVDKVVHGHNPGQP